MSLSDHPTLEPTKDSRGRQASDIPCLNINIFAPGKPRRLPGEQTNVTKQQNENRHFHPGSQSVKPRRLIGELTK